MDDILKCYRVLDLEPGATAERVRRAYIELTQVWDPSKHVSNPILRAQSEQKRKEIDEAYASLKVFLPELRSPGDKPKTEDRVQRDFTELATGSRVVPARTLMGILAGIVLILIFYSAYVLLNKGRTATVTSETPVAAPLE